MITEVHVYLTFLGLLYHIYSGYQVSFLGVKRPGSWR
jgi:hypothetical protein